MAGSHHLLPPRVCVIRNWTQEPNRDVNPGTLTWVVDSPGILPPGPWRKTA